MIERSQGRDSRWEPKSRNWSRLWRNSDIRLALYNWLSPHSQLLFSDHLHRNGSHNGLGLPTLVINQENAPQIWLRQVFHYLILILLLLLLLLLETNQNSTAEDSRCLFLLHIPSISISFGSPLTHHFWLTASGSNSTRPVAVCQTRRWIPWMGVGVGARIPC